MFKFILGVLGLVGVFVVVQGLTWYFHFLSKGNLVLPMGEGTVFFSAMFTIVAFIAYGIAVIAYLDAIETTKRVEAKANNRYNN